jgi:non-ribosomal peptide synthetase component F
VNTLVLRTRVHGHERFAELLARRARPAAGLCPPGPPFEQLVEALQPERHRSHTPLFQVMLVLQNMPMAPLALPGLELVARAPTARTAKFDLTLTLHEAADGRLRADFEYATALFDRPTIERLAEHFERLLEQVALTASVSSATSSCGQGGAREIARWNDTSCLPQSVHTCTRWQAQARRTPQAVARGLRDRPDLHELNGAPTAWPMSCGRGLRVGDGVRFACRAAAGRRRAAGRARTRRRLRS